MEYFIVESIQLDTYNIISILRPINVIGKGTLVPFVMEQKGLLYFVPNDYMADKDVGGRGNSDEFVPCD